MTRAALRIALVLLLFGVARTAAAQDGLPIGLSFASDEHSLTLTIESFDRLEGVRVDVRRLVDRRTFDFTRAELDAGARWELELPVPDRTSDYTIRVAGSVGGLNGVVEDTFTIPVLEPMDFSVDTNTFDEEARRFTMTMTQPAGHVELTVRSDEGSLLAERTIQFNGEAPGTPLTVTWSQPPGNIMTIDVRAYSESGAWAGRTYIPWKVDLEPAHVNFESGSAEIPAADLPMLRARLAEIRATADRASEWVEVRLYIAGYTDTVGSSADNQRLSEERARSIARFFRSEGLRFPIFTQGFGESALAVATADNVDEPANRRTLFILTTFDPPLSSNIPRNAWRLLE